MSLLLQCRSILIPCAALTPTPPYRSDNADAIYIDKDTHIQILDTMTDLMTDLSRADSLRDQCGAFIVRLI
jgi:hypothetical protein